MAPGALICAAGRSDKYKIPRDYVSMVAWNFYTSQGGKQ